MLAQNCCAIMGGREKARCFFALQLYPNKLEMAEHHILLGDYHTKTYSQ